MRFLIDADLPRRTANLLLRYGHDAIDVRDTDLAEAKDVLIAARAKADGLSILTGDFGFADVRSFPPDEYQGIVVLEIPNDATAPFILTLLESFLRRADLVAKLPGRLAIVSAGRVRMRPK
jgi:predicted nuclease of predicted toxin-antitoxin system